MSIEQTLVSLGGALLIAMITVYLAFWRFKRERLWDRRLITFSDMVESLSEMNRVHGILWDRMAEGRDDETEGAKKYIAELHDRFKTANRKFESASATARLILGPDVEDVIKKFFKGMDHARQTTDYTVHMDREGDALAEALKAILALGRKAHGTNR